MIATRVLILDNSIFPDIYQPDRHWRVLLGPTSADTIHVPSARRLPNVAPYSHVIVTGSEASITKSRPWFAAEEEVILNAIALGRPVLGSCFGHQMLVRAVSGERFVRESPTPEVGWIRVERTVSDELLSGLPSTLHVFAAHFDEVVAPPAPWRVVAQSEGCAVQIVRHGSRPVWGLQAHPEIAVEDAITLMRGELGKFPEKASLIERGLGQVPDDDCFAGALVKRFLEVDSVRSPNVRDG
jgi:GMP synthase-like glutamine amidotransferase